MAHVTTDFPSTSAPATGFFDTLLNAFARMAEANTRIKQVERLQDLSDDELAAKNIRREDIARHVYRDVLYI